MTLTGLILLLFTLSHCTGGSALNPGGHGKTILPWVENRRYLAWDGTEPVLLLGAGNDPFLKVNYERIIRENSQAGGNYIDCHLVGATAKSRGPFAYDQQRRAFALDAPDSVYWQNLTDIISTAASYNTVVNLTGSRGELYPDYLGADSVAYRNRFAKLVDQAAGEARNVTELAAPRFTNTATDSPPKTRQGWFADKLLSGQPAVEYPDLD